MAFDFNKISDNNSNNDALDYIWMCDQLYNNFHYITDWNFYGAERNKLNTQIKKLFNNKNKISDAIINILNIAQRYKILSMSEFLKYTGDISIKFIDKNIKRLFTKNTKFNPMDYNVETIALLYIFVKYSGSNITIKSSRVNDNLKYIEILYIEIYFPFSYNQNLLFLRDYHCTEKDCPELINMLKQYRAENYIK